MGTRQPFRPGSFVVSRQAAQLRGLCCQQACLVVEFGFGVVDDVNLPCPDWGRLSPVGGGGMVVCALVLLCDSENSVRVPGLVFGAGNRLPGGRICDARKGWTRREEVSWMLGCKLNVIVDKHVPHAPGGRPWCTGRG